MPLTPLVFCAVRAVMAEAPYTPSAANVFRSAWMPAPPEESEPAMVSAIGVVIARLAGIEIVASGPCPVLARRVIASKFLRAILHQARSLVETTAMVPFFVQIKCKLGQSYIVANALAEAEIASQISSTARDYDSLTAFH